jgi:hypothetical protein
VSGFCEHGNENSGFIKKTGYFSKSRVTIGFSNNILHHGVRVSECVSIITSFVILFSVYILLRKRTNSTRKCLFRLSNQEADGQKC